MAQASTSGESVNLWRNADHAINYLEKRALIPRRADAYEVLFEIMPGGFFANVEHVASTTPKRHEEFLYALGSSPEQDDPSNKLVAVEAHLSGLNASGYADAECLWKWRELAVVTGTKPR